MYPTETEVDNVSDLSVSTPGIFEELPGCNEWTDDARRNDEAEADQDFTAMTAAAEADDIDAETVMGDLTRRRWAEIMAMCPTDTKWRPEVAYHAERPDEPYRAQLRRGTPNGPDMIRLAYFASAANALTAAVLHLINMTLIEKGYGDDETRDALRRQVEYATR